MLWPKIDQVQTINLLKYGTKCSNPNFTTPSSHIIGDRDTNHVNPLGTPQSTWHQATNPSSTYLVKARHSF